jgi:hypothetical protein
MVPAPRYSAGADTSYLRRNTLFLVVLFAFTGCSLVSIGTLSPQFLSPKSNGKADVTLQPFFYIAIILVLIGKIYMNVCENCIA